MHLYCITLTTNDCRKKANILYCRMIFFSHAKSLYIRLELHEFISKMTEDTLICLINVGLQITVGSGKKYKPNEKEVWNGTNGGPGIFVTLIYKEAFENSHFFRFSPNFSMISFKNK